MYSFVPGVKMNGKLGLMLDFHYDSLIFKELYFFMNGNSIMVNIQRHHLKFTYLIQSD